MTKLRPVTLMLLVLCLVSCSQKPTFSDIIHTYQGNSQAFRTLSSLACRLGKSNNLNRYDPRDATQGRIPKLDKLLAQISAKNIVYRAGDKAQCTLALQIYAQGFAGMGQTYAYRYQIDSPALFDDAVHSYDNVASMQENISFDMPLTVDEQFDGWYFSFIYNHDA